MQDDHVTVLLEHIESQNRAILEAVGAMQQQVARIPQMQSDITELKQDMKVVKAAVTENSNDIHKLEQCVTRLEAA